MRIASITAGAAGMYCGSCMRDNTLVAELHRRNVTFLHMAMGEQAPKSLAIRSAKTHATPVIVCCGLTPRFVGKTDESAT